MIIKQFADYLEKNGKNWGCGRYHTLVQKLWVAENIWDIIPQEIIETYHIQKNFIIGLETVPANLDVKLHTDFPNRKCNLLFNIGETPAIITHTHNDEPEEVTILPNNLFLLDTVKKHGSFNKTDYDYKFFTINCRQWYLEAQRLWDGQI